MRYLFKHILMRDTAYNMQLHVRVRALHRRAAAAIEALYEDVQPYYADLAYHYGRAEMPEQERHYALLAGEQAAAEFANDEAARLFSRALALTPPDAVDARRELLLLREKVYNLQGDRGRQVRDIEALEALVAEGDVPARVAVALRRADYWSAVGEYEAAMDVTRQALAWAESLAAPVLKVQVYRQFVIPLMRQGNYQEARAWLEKALVLARGARMYQEECETLIGLGATCHYQEDYALADRYYQRALVIARQLHDVLGESVLLGNLGLVAAELGRYDEAVDYQRAALHLKGQTGDREGESWTLNNLGILAADQGRYGDAIGYYERAIRLCREISDRWSESNALLNLGIVHWSLGDAAGARRRYDEGLTIKRHIQDQHGLGLGLAFQARLLDSLGETSAALAGVQEALSIARELEDYTTQAYAQTYLAHIREGMGALADAQTAYERALALWQDLGNAVMALEPRAGLVRVARAQGDAEAVRTHVAELLPCLAAHPDLVGLVEPVRVYLACYRALRNAQPERARALLRSAHALLHSRAANIPDPALRRSYLEDVPAHREVMALFTSGGNGGQA